jgi:hypothetical protein
LRSHGRDAGRAHFRVAGFLSVKIENVHGHAVFHFHLAEIVELRLPIPLLLQIFGDPLRQQDVSGIAAISAHFVERN